MKDERKKCNECGAYGGHSHDCSHIDLEDAKRQLKQYYDLWLDRENIRRADQSRAQERYTKIRHEAEFWKGKFMVVKNENNKIRKNNHRYINKN